MVLPLVSMLAVGAAMLLLLGRARGHMIMNTPAPYNLAMPPLLQVDPISGGHFPFPCHNQYGFTSRTPVEAGGATLVNFTGGGQHGGGSCQFSISWDEPVHGADWNKSAVFKTIYSIIGGCPALFTNETLNLAPAAVDQDRRQDSKHCGNDTGIDCIRQFMVPIPKFLKNGPATFAWTWFNKLGNKEMYMNCAPISVTGGTGDEQQIRDLPDIFVANYPDDPEVSNCITGTSNDKVVVNFPNPGRYGRVLQEPVEPDNKPSGYCTQIPPARAIPTFENNPQTTGSVKSGNTINSTACSTSPAASSQLASSASVFLTITPISQTSTASSSSESTTSTNTTRVLPTTHIPITSTQTTSTMPHLSSSKSPPCVVLPTGNVTTESTSGNLSPHTPMGPRPTVNKPNGQAVPCATHGELICLSEVMFGLCNWGWAIPQPVAAGTECKEGRIVKGNATTDGYASKGGR